MDRKRESSDGEILHAMCVWQRPYFNRKIRTKRGKEFCTKRRGRKKEKGDVRKKVRKPKVEEYRSKANIRRDMQATYGDSRGASRGKKKPLSLSLSMREISPLLSEEEEIARERDDMPKRDKTENIEEGEDNITKKDHAKCCEEKKREKESRQ